MRILELLVIARVMSGVLATHDTTAQKGCMRLAPDSVVITGVLERITFPGRPNYSDVKAGDEPETGFYLRVKPALCTIAQRDIAAKKNIQLVQLVLDSAGYDRLRPRLGTVVSIRGTLLEASTGHHHAPVVLNVFAEKPNRGGARRDPNER